MLVGIRVEQQLKTSLRKYLEANHKRLLQYWTGYLTIQTFSDKVVSSRRTS